MVPLMAGQDSWPRPLRILNHSSLSLRERALFRGAKGYYGQVLDSELTEETYVVGEQVSDIGNLMADHAQPLDS